MTFNRRVEVFYCMLESVCSFSTKAEPSQVTTIIANLGKISTHSLEVEAIHTVDFINWLVYTKQLRDITMLTQPLICVEIITGPIEKKRKPQPLLTSCHGPKLHLTHGQGKVPDWRWLLHCRGHIRMERFRLIRPKAQSSHRRL
ncbi:hypothetical protein IA69_03240 [Massilia sp. JS1662]|nr:hypothetical protein IA69_03240 [Massilia sp. JS1662]